jgi:release factor glutamine methyltransferase
MQEKPSRNSFTLKKVLEAGTQQLLQATTDLRGARLDARILLAHVLGLETAALYAYPEQHVTQEQQCQFQALIERRQQGEPVAYLLGTKNFYGRDFFVDRRVLIPRPETELLVEIALGIIRAQAPEQLVVADVGCGSGAIPVTIAAEEPRLPYLYGCDISTEALEVARINCQRHHVAARVRLLQGDLLAPLPEPVDLLLANLPYVGTEEITAMSPDVYTYEPHLALFSGPYGLDLLRRFCKEVQESGRLKAGATLLLEIGYQQCLPLTALLQALWPQATIACLKDYAGWDRLLQVTLPY